MTLRELVDRYLEQAGGFGRTIHLSELGLGKAELERELSAYEEDYQISRFFHLTLDTEAEHETRPGGAPVYTINGFDYSHVAILPEIQEIL
ncbi:MAG TPA: hypothetical protein VNN18_09765 [Candidatus Xenobia bacterium]|nr:hypothetical protein [Candidatus Xenobia bacterium]